MVCKCVGSRDGNSEFATCLVFIRQIPRSSDNIMSFQHFYFNIQMSKQYFIILCLSPRILHCNIYALTAIAKTKER